MRKDKKDSFYVVLMMVFLGELVVKVINIIANGSEIASFLLLMFVVILVSWLGIKEINKK